MTKPYEAIDHTGDIGVQVWGRDEKELLENASRALTDTMVEIETVRALKEATWNLTADTLESLLVRQLHEIIYQLDANGMIFHDFSLTILPGFRLQCVAWGEALDRERHRFKTELKAVTYHHLEIRKEPTGGWIAKVIFDV